MLKMILATGFGVQTKLQESVSPVTDSNCWACGYCDSKISEFSVGMLAALLAASIFIFIATVLKLPVSTTHATVGALVGMTITGIGGNCVDWSINGVGGIFVSWVISPLLAGGLAVFFYILIDKYIFSAPDPRSRVFKFFPAISSAICAAMLIAILKKSGPTKVKFLLLFLI